MQQDTDRFAFYRLIWTASMHKTMKKLQAMLSGHNFKHTVDREATIIVWFQKHNTITDPKKEMNRPTHIIIEMKFFIKSPSFVSGSPACIAGLQKDDAIIKINSKNVSRSIADTVAKIVRNSESEVTLECYRANPFTTSDQCVPDMGANAKVWSPYSPPEGFERAHNQKVQQRRQKSPNQVVPSASPRSELSVHSSPPCLYHVQVRPKIIHVYREKMCFETYSDNVQTWKMFRIVKVFISGMLYSKMWSEGVCKLRSLVCCFNLLSIFKSVMGSISIRDFGIIRYLVPFWPWSSRLIRDLPGWVPYTQHWVAEACAEGGNFPRLQPPSCAICNTRTLSFGCLMKTIELCTVVI